MKDCMFCQIVAGTAPCLKVAEDAETLVILDVAGDVDGHMLAIPKKHCESLLDVDEEALAHLMESVRRVARHCVTRCGYQGVNLLHASGASAGQSVPHLHIHIIPRREGDGVDAWPSLPGAAKSREAMAEALRMK